VIRTTYTFLMCHNFKFLRLSNRFDFQFSQSLPMSIFTTVPFSTFLFENDDLIIFEMLDYGSGNSYIDQWGSHLNIVTIGGQIHLIKTHLAAFFSIEAVNIKLLTFCNLELLAGYGYYREHMIIELFYNLVCKSRTIFSYCQTLLEIF